MKSTDNSFNLGHAKKMVNSIVYGVFSNSNSL